MNSLTVTEKQYDFLSTYHETVELGQIMLNFFCDEKILVSLEKREDYQALFKGMSWDDIYDRYQEYPGYDISFRLKLYSQFNSLNFMSC